jgi:hypothetical protein
VGVFTSMDARAMLDEATTSVPHDCFVEDGSADATLPMMNCYSWWLLTADATISSTEETLELPLVESLASIEGLSTMTVFCSMDA